MKYAMRVENWPFTSIKNVLHINARSSSSSSLSSSALPAFVFTNDGLSTSFSVFTTACTASAIIFELNSRAWILAADDPGSCGSIRDLLGSFSSTAAFTSSFLDSSPSLRTFVRNAVLPNCSWLACWKASRVTHPQKSGVLPSRTHLQHLQLPFHLRGIVAFHIVLGAITPTQRIGHNSGQPA